MTGPLERFAQVADRAGLFLDFDGTLAEIVTLPDDARPLAGAPEVLTALGQRLAGLIIVSGRSAQQLVDWLGPGVEIWGVHGAERAVGGRVETTRQAMPYVEMMGRVRDEAMAAVSALGIDGIVVEDKGVMVGLHYRATNDRAAAEAALEQIATELAAKHELLRASGKLAFELRPPVRFSKKTVVLERSRELGLTGVGFMGDDVVDLPGFDAVDELVAAGALGLRIAVDSDEAPAELIERADIVVPGPSAALALLNDLLALAGG